MSSVLKALRQQQSKLVPAQPAIYLEPAHKQQRSFMGLIWLLIPIAALVGWWLVHWWTTAPAEQPAAPVASSPQWEIGAPQPVRVVELPEENAVVTTPPEPAVEATQPTRSSFAQPEALAQNQTVDLNEVPADLLSAFEEALTATGGSSGQQNSVLPRISELNSSLQGRIPDFSYDAHQYSSRVSDRFIELAGQRLRQGDNWQGIQVLSIAPNHVVLALGNDAFQQPALEDWTSAR
ncbi:general secretion pathway protein GspB [Pseudidiomarina terrestris]|uniref:General secretion pathway protein GspB n=1 Tax=Pseudidiomarina terrestris TaxID=2820060 RepID=A0ABT8MK76_9GAMM|nr:MULTISPECIES: general secretion pathway protein GspB [unclassified Pseudidiomarina]MDN7127564.1 general secretion pathway protein GspB [Pseudidiomarina sp. 1APR75-33.1]MDN7130310.1 general secretion pathway protein GspB [Pseudidiomarina sp. 1APR75-15]MDN7136233.1 general secretion pathway protein GspB [Pseudidiomarina sp. 1ASP75-5]